MRVKLATGELVWSVDRRSLGSAARSGRTCRASQGAAVTAIPGAVLLRLARRRHARLLDQGRHRSSGRSIRTGISTTVNGVKANGGGIEGPGAIVAGGMLYFNSGYGGFVGNPGNVLLAFGID